MYAEQDPVEMARLHADGGLLKTQKGGGYQVRLGRNIPSRPSAYAVHASKLLGAAEAYPMIRAGAFTNERGDDRLSPTGPLGPTGPEQHCEFNVVQVV